jgi:uncharacterized protein (TIGR03083 family)|tara:strand:+ start:620 stop:1411 length:792 start_codon:yes stop_codon:yes gene_type:complete
MCEDDRRPASHGKGASVKPSEYEKLFQKNAAVITESAKGNLDASVPAVAGWTLRELTIHIGGVWAFVSRSVAQGRSIDPEHGVATWGMAQANRPTTENLAAWHSLQAQNLQKVIYSLKPEQNVWSSNLMDPTASYWMRRMCVEAAIHRWDAQSVTSTGSEIDVELAIEGIDEFLDFFIPQRIPKSFAGAGTVHFHCTDGPGEWLITRTSEGIEVDRSHAKGDVALRGAASDLLLWVWGRKNFSELETFGDTDLLEEWQANVRI